MKILAIATAAFGILALGCGVTMFVLKIKDAVVGHMILGGITVVLAVILAVLHIIGK